MLGAKNVRIDHKIRGNGRSLSIPKVTNLEVEDVIGPNGGNSAIQNAPFAEPLVYVAKSKRFTA